MARVRIDDNVNQPSGRVIVVVPGLKVQVVQPGTTTAVTVYQAETGGSTHSWFGTDARGVVVPFTADPATTGVAIAGGEMWVETGQTVELRVLQAAVEVGRKRYPAISPSVESGSGHFDRSPFIDLTTGRYNVSDGDDITAELTDAITRYAPTANQTGLVIYMPGDFELSGQIVFPAYITPLGAGSRTATRIKCMTADAGFVVRSRGPLCGRFTIDGNSTATQPFYTDGVDRNFEDIDIRNSLGDGCVIENAQNCTIVGLGINESGDSALVFRNGASTNRVYGLRITGFNEYGIKQHQTVAQGAAYPNGLSGTILAQGPNHNKAYGPIIERVGTTVGGGTVGTGLGGVLLKGGVLSLDRPVFSIVPTAGTDVAVFEMDHDGVSTVNRLIVDDVQALGDLTRGIFIWMKDTTAATSATVRGGEIQAFRCAYKLADIAGTRIRAKVPSEFYNNVTSRFENVGAGTKTYDNLVRDSLSEPIDWTRPASTDQILTVKRSADAGYRAGLTADGILYQGDASTTTLTSYPGLFVGAGSPEGTVSARIGSIYRQTDAATTGSSVWTKATGTGTTGWVPATSTSITTIATDANATIASTTIAEQTFHTGTLTADRTLTFNAATASGQRRTITRTGSGAFNLIISNRGVGTVKSLATNQWADMVWNGTDWVLQRFGSL